MAINATVLDISKRALRKIGALDVREDMASEDAALCAQLLEDLIIGLPGWTQWNEVEINQDYTAGDDERIAVIGDVDVTITLPQLVFMEPYITFDSSGFSIKNGTYYQAPRDGSRVMVYAQQGVDPATDQAFFAYRADTGKWCQVTGLTSSSEVPLNQNVHHHLSTILAVNAATEYGVPVSAELAMMFKSAKAAMLARYGTQRYRPSSPATRGGDISAYM